MTTGKSDLVELDCEFFHETEKAILISTGGEKTWLPKSMVEFEDGKLTLPEWLAIEKSLI